MTLANAGTKTLVLAAGAATNTVSGTLTAAGTGRVVIDTLGFDYATIDTILGLADVVSNSPTLLTLAELTSTTTSTASTLTQFSGGTATATNVAWVIPTGAITATSNGANVYRFNVDLRPRQRYLMVSCSPATTQTMVVDVRLGRAEAIPAIGPVGASGTNVTGGGFNTLATVEG